MKRSTIKYCLAECQHAHVLVAAGERGICQLRLGDDPRALETGLLETFPDARPAAGGAAVRAWCAEIVRHLDAWDGRGAPPALPLELRGTPFQLRVWAALREIPAGSVRTYSEVAAQVGVRDGARAVANVCASNPVAVLVPCHRVVPRSGGVGGYRWGERIKRWLLAGEGAVITARARRSEPEGDRAVP
jgi:AraC family transcriptional regulator of adaptative response/methylated-DNA-[protein]-cysteine methyltransferase